MGCELVDREEKEGKGAKTCARVPKAIREIKDAINVALRRLRLLAAIAETVTVLPTVRGIFGGASSSSQLFMSGEQNGSVPALGSKRLL